MRKREDIGHLQGNARAIMTSLDVRQIVEKEIGSERTRQNAHGCDISRCLVEPHLSEYENCAGPGASGKIRLWIVLEEDPATCNGYQIVYEEASGMFGLGCPGINGPIFIGRYGDFLTTYDAM